VRVAAHHLGNEALKHVRHGEFAAFRRNLAVKDHLEQQVAELFLQVRAVVGLQRFEDLVGLLDEVRL